MDNNKKRIYYDMRSVISIMRERRDTHSMPKDRHDQYRIGLVVEGGGMTAAVTAAMANALVQSGYGNVFDAVYGSSAGALISAYFIADQSENLVNHYQELCLDGTFINKRRFLTRKGPLINLEHFAAHHSLDFNQVLTSDIELHIAVTRVPGAIGDFLSSFNHTDMLHLAITASARVPVFAGDPIIINQQAYIDGAITYPLPYEIAMQTCTHVLVLQTRPIHQAAKDISWAQAQMVKHMMGRVDREVANAIMQRPALYAQQLQYLQNASDNRIQVITPSARFCLPTGLDQRRDRVQTGIMAGEEAVAVFNQ